MMGDQRADAPTGRAMTRLLAQVAPGSSLVAIEPLPGSYSNSTHLVRARSKNGSSLRLVVRRYREFGSYDRGEKARREFHTFELVLEHGIPAPQPVYLDDEGAILGTPGIVTRYVEGAQVASPPDPTAFAHALAAMLARIHEVPCGPETEGFLLDANSEASWFLRSGKVPDYMRAHPQGTAVWCRARDLLPRLQEVEPTLVHIDYWPGNVLWSEGRINAIVDWEEAAFGDPGIDVAYCRMQLFVKSTGWVADEFLDAYEREAAQPVLNLSFWELAAAVRPMFSQEGWIDSSPARERFREFVGEALVRAGA
jgi:aminoglycoside phosphotransferase (APT) family kinase protein